MGCLDEGLIVRGDRDNDNISHTESKVRLQRKGDGVVPRLILSKNGELNDRSRLRETVRCVGSSVEDSGFKTYFKIYFRISHYKR